MNQWNNFQTLRHYEGIIWVSKLFETESRGNICFYKSGDFHVIAYVAPEEYIEKGLDGVVKSRVHGLGLQYMLEEKGE